MRSKQTFILFGLCLFIMISSLSSAQENAEGIINRVTERKKEETEQVNVSMRVQSADGKDREAERSFLIQGKYAVNNDSKTLISFLTPRGIKGTKILTIKEGANTAQWIYLPTVKKPSLVNSDQDMEGILDSDLSYSDIKEESTEDYAYTLNTGKLEEYAASVCKEPAFSLTAISKKANSVYSKRTLSVSKSKYVVCGIILYDKAGKISKNIQNYDFKKIGDHWRPGKSIIASHKTPTLIASKTLLTYTNWKAGVKLEPTLFSANSLGQ